MSPINFDTFATERPELAPVWTGLKSWFASNHFKRYAELDLIKKAVPDENSIALLDAINTMIGAGMLERALKVRAPSGELLAGEFRTRKDIPEELPDRFH